MTKTVIAAALGECIHVTGVSNFLRLAESAGWKTFFMGPAVPIDQVTEVAKQEKADLVGVSYRLTPNRRAIIGTFAESADNLHNPGIKFAFGETLPVAEKARQWGFFERVFDGSEPTEVVLAYLKGEENEPEIEFDYPQTALERIQWKAPYPIICHHFGLSTLQDTLAGIEKIANAKAIDVISPGIDQDAQENFFRPECQDPRRKGAGG